MKNKKYAVLVLVAATVATLLLLSSKVQSQPNASPQMKLGGAFIGTSSGGEHIWNVFQIPLDPAGRTAALKVMSFTYPADLAGLLTMFGADSLGGEATGQTEMISRDTAKWRFVSYGTKQGNPPLIKLIFVWWGTIQFRDPDNAVVNYTAEVYLAAADANKDGLPDEGAQPLPLPIPISGTGTAQRVLP